MHAGISALSSSRLAFLLVGGFIFYAPAKLVHLLGDGGRGTSICDNVVAKRAPFFMGRPGGSEISMNSALSLSHSSEFKLRAYFCLYRFSGNKLVEIGILTWNVDFSLYCSTMHDVSLPLCFFPCLADSSLLSDLDG